MLKVKLWYFFANFIVVNFDLISNIFSSRYASRTLRIKLLTWCRIVSQVGVFRLCRAQACICQNIFDLHTKLISSIRSNDFFLS